MLLAEELYLLIRTASIRDRGPALRGDLALAGAVLVELDENDRLAFTEERDGVEAGRVLVMDEEGTGHPALDGALGRLLEVEGGLPQDTLAAMAEGLTGELADALNRSGLLETAEEGADRVGVEAEHSAEELRTELRELRRSGSASDQRIAQLLGLIVGADLVAVVLGPAGEATGETADAELARREFQATEGVWIRDVLAKAVQSGGMSEPGTGPPLV